MRKTKIAPELQRVIPAWVERTQGARTHEAVQAEVRALLAVAKAAEDHSHADVEYDPVSEMHLCPICRALSRLRHAAGERSGR